MPFCVVSCVFACFQDIAPRTSYLDPELIRRLRDSECESDMRPKLKGSAAVQLCSPNKHHSTYSRLMTSIVISDWSGNVRSLKDLVAEEAV